MNYVISLGKIDYEGRGKVNEVTILVRMETRGAGLSIDLKEIQYTQLSICGGIWNRRKTDVMSAGQNYDTIRSFFGTDPDVKRLIEIWERWHLNDMRSGCRHQIDEGWNERRIDPNKPLDAYGKHCVGQRSPSWNMLTWISRDEHPMGLLGEGCDKCGYKYGTRWLIEEIPAEVLNELTEICERLHAIPMA